MTRTTRHETPCLARPVPSPGGRGRRAWTFLAALVLMMGLVLAAPPARAQDDYKTRWRDAVRADPASALVRVEADERDALVRAYARAEALQRLGRYDEAQASFLDAAAVANRRGHAEAEADAYAFAGITAGTASDLALAEERFRASLDVARAAGLDRAAFDALTNIANVQVETFDPAGAIAVLAEAEALARRAEAAGTFARTDFERAVIPYTSAEAYLMLGDGAAADAQIRRGWPFAQRVETPTYTRPLYAALAGRRALARGEAARGLRLLSTAWADREALVYAEYRLDVALAYADALLANADPEGALSMLSFAEAELGTSAGTGARYASDVAVLEGRIAAARGDDAAAAAAFARSRDAYATFFTEERAQVFAELAASSERRIERQRLELSEAKQTLLREQARRRDLGVLLAVLALAPVVLLYASRQRRIRRESEAAAARASDRRVYQERLRIARDLHDTLLQDLMSISLLVQGKRAAGERSGDDLPSVLDDIGRRAREAAARGREAIAGYRETEPRDAVEGLARHAREVAAALGAEVEIEASGHTAPFEPDTLDAMRDIVGEAVRNAIRHGTSPATVTVEGQPDAARVQVANAGVGWNVDAAHPGRYGLVGMRERASLADLDLVIEVDEVGTRLSLEARR